jgi:hypothetical protein
MKPSQITLRVSKYNNQLLQLSNKNSFPSIEAPKNQKLHDLNLHGGR